MLPNKYTWMVVVQYAYGTRQRGEIVSRHRTYAAAYRAINRHPNGELPRKLCRSEGDMIDLILLAFVPIAAFTIFVSIMLAWGAR